MESLVSRSEYSQCTKRCPRCQEVKSVDDFHRQSRLSDGRQTYCKQCSHVFAVASKYGMSPERYSVLTADGCAICGSIDNLHVDHDHSCCSGKTSCGSCIRGVLCAAHNKGIGQFDDNTEMLLKAIEYLNRPPLSPEDYRLTRQAKTHCKNGHPGWTTGVGCRECKVLANRRYRERQKSQRL